MVKRKKKVNSKRAPRRVVGSVGKDWMGEVARDIISLGGIPFFALVLTRVYILSDPSFFFQFLVAGILFFILALLVKASIYSGLGLIAGFFTLLHYNASAFTAIAIITYGLLLASLDYLGKRRSWILLGMMFGAIATAISYYAVDWFFAAFL